MYFFLHIPSLLLPNIFSVLSSAAHILKLEYYTEKVSIILVQIHDPFRIFSIKKYWSLLIFLRSTFSVMHWQSSSLLPTAFVNGVTLIRAGEIGVHTSSQEGDFEFGTHCSQRIFLNCESDHETPLCNTIQWFPIALQIKSHSCCVATGKLLNLFLAQFPLV